MDTHFLKPQNPLPSHKLTSHKPPPNKSIRLCCPLSLSSLDSLSSVSPDSFRYASGMLEFFESVNGSVRSNDVAIESQLNFALKFSDVWIKREDLQPVFSFKLGGAYNTMAKLPAKQLERGVICSSAGNHAQGVALAAKKLGCDAIIIMPVTTPEIKWRAVEKLGATVVRVGDSYDEAQSYAQKRGKDEGRTFIPPFDHPDVIMGQGTVGMEIIRQILKPLPAIFVPVSGGGFITGNAAYVKRVSPEVRIIGVEPADANAMALSLHHGQRVALDQVGGFADGVAVKVVGEETFHICKELMDGVVLVSRDAICASIKDMFEEKRSILEPAGALAFAGAEAYCKYYDIKGETVVAIASGANMNFDRLRLVTELANVGKQREAVLATFLPEERGSFKKFAALGHHHMHESRGLCLLEGQTVGTVGFLTVKPTPSRFRFCRVLCSNDPYKNWVKHPIHKVASFKSLCLPSGIEFVPKESKKDEETSVVTVEEETEFSKTWKAFQGLLWKKVSQLDHIPERYERNAQVMLWVVAGFGVALATFFSVFYVAACKNCVENMMNSGKLHPLLCPPTATVEILEKTEKKQLGEIADKKLHERISVRKF